MFDAVGWEIGRVKFFERNRERNNSGRHQRHDRRGDHNVGATAEAAVARTSFTGVAGRVAGKNA